MRTKSPANRIPESQSTLFSNASRSPRNLAVLVARTHSPSGDENSDVSLMSIIAGDTAQIRKEESKAPIDGPEVRKDFSLPALAFRPLSLNLNHSRPSTALESPNQTSFPILSPTPERPASAQSRERFSKILDIDKDPSSRGMCRSSCVNNKTTMMAKLETVTEVISPSKAPPKPMPDLSTASGPSSERGELQDSWNAGQDDPRTSCNMTNDPSTVDSLLEKHIECLGLDLDGQPISESDAESNQSHDSEVDTIHGSRYFVRASTKGLVKLDTHSRSTTRENHDYDEQLIPPRLFAGLDSKSSTGTAMSPKLGMSSSTSQSDATIPSYG